MAFHDYRAKCTLALVCHALAQYYNKVTKHCLQIIAVQGMLDYNSTCKQPTVRLVLTSSTEVIAFLAITEYSSISSAR